MNIIVNVLVNPFAIKIGPVSVIYMIISWKQTNLEQSHLEVKKLIRQKRNKNRQQKLGQKFVFFFSPYQILNKFMNAKET